MSKHAYETRKQLTFGQAEGVEPLPTQLQFKQVSKELRARLWEVVHGSLLDSAGYSAGGYRIMGRWGYILRDMHIRYFHRMVDDYRDESVVQVGETRLLIQNGDYVAIFGWIQWVLRHRHVPSGFAEEIDSVLKDCRAAYRVVGGDTIMPLSSEAELKTLERAFADLAATEFRGARAHLRNAAAELTEGRWADSVRESIHAVESVARLLEPSGEFSNALAQLEKTVGLHGAMRKGFGALYGYTSDEKGIRHPMLDEDAPKVDETDALFMLGACAAFVSYLIGKARTAGLLSRQQAA